uniref:Uncharacterized protein n=1 Tax=Oryzias melastigma TaxID=30732 RepID=A0A3B3CR11_ORYME
MTPKWVQRVSVGCCGAVMMITISAILFVWYQWDPTTGYSPNVNDTNLKPRTKRFLENYVWNGIPAIMTWTYNHSIRITVGLNTTTSVQIPIKTLKNPWGQTGEGRQGYWWYLTGHPVRTDWDTLITTEQGNYWPPGSGPEAQFFKDKIVMTHNGDSLNLRVTFMDGSDKPPNASFFNTSCWGFQLWAWSSGTDQSFPILMCVNSSMNVGDKPTVNNYTKQVGITVMSILNSDTDGWFRITTGVSGQSNNWLLLVEQAAKAVGIDCIVCMGSRPLLQIIPAVLPPHCVIPVMNETNIKEKNCASWDLVFPITGLEKQKPLFSKKVAMGNFTCISLQGQGEPLGKLNFSRWCTTTYNVLANFRSVSRSDIWWWCGDDRLFDRLPANVKGHCALVSLLLPVSVFSTTIEKLMYFTDSVLPGRRIVRKKSLTWNVNDPTYIDAIGIPRGVPDEYKLVDQVAAGFESSICWWCTINKNVDRINYIHYNVQKLGNWTQSGFEAVHGQLATTSLMTFQNRIALDMLLAEKGGVCSMFGEQCCSFIPNNTAADGSLTKAIEGLRSLNSKMKEHSGVDTSMWDSWLNAFGKYRSLVSSILVSIAVFAAILTLCGCCCIPCLRSLLNRLISTAISPMQQDVTQMLPLLGAMNEDDEENDLEGLPNLFSKPDDSN